MVTIRRSSLCAAEARAYTHKKRTLELEIAAAVWLVSYDWRPAPRLYAPLILLGACRAVQRGAYTERGFSFKCGPWTPYATIRL